MNTGAVLRHGQLYCPPDWNGFLRKRFIAFTRGKLDRYPTTYVEDRRDQHLWRRLAILTCRLTIVCQHSIHQSIDYLCSQPQKRRKLRRANNCMLSHRVIVVRVCSHQYSQHACRKNVSVVISAFGRRSSRLNSYFSVIDLHNRDKRFHKRKET